MSPSFNIMSKYPALLIVVALVAVMFAGCTSSAPAHVASNHYNSGDIVTNNPLDIGGFLIVKYDPVDDMYTLHRVILGPGSWYYLENQTIYVNRNYLESPSFSKIGYVSDPSSIPTAHVGGGPADGPDNGDAPRYYPGDVVSYSRYEIDGFLILKYDPINGMYTIQHILNWSGTWHLLEPLQMFENRSDLESNFPSKIGYISDQSIIIQTPPTHSVAGGEGGPGD